MCSIKRFPIKSWKRWTLCDGCKMAFAKGTVMYFTATGETYCSHLCESLHTVNEPETPDLLAEMAQ